MKNVLKIGVLVLLAMLVFGCSKGPEIADTLIENEFRHAWKSIHGESGQKGYRWKLTSMKIGNKTVNEQGTRAKVKIFFKYLDASGKNLERTGSFVFHRKGKSWELEDRNARNMSSSTRYHITP